MTTTYTLTYFDVRGRAEPIRLLLAYAGVPFEDRGLSGDAWAKERSDAPLGQLPYLTEHHDGEARAIPQTMAIVRHLARQHGLDGKDEGERLAVDVAAETANDARAAHSTLRFSPAWTDDATKAKFAAETLPTHLARLDKLLGDLEWFGSRWASGASAPTYADLVAFDTLDRLVASWPTLLEGWPRLAAFQARVQALPQLAKYLSTRRPG
jgi:glutathione S-transferase